MKKYLLATTSAAMLAASVAMSAQAAETPDANQDLTFGGITLYGNIDVGLSYQTHGVPMSDSFYPAQEWLISKNSNKSQFNIGPGGLSQSVIGLKGFEEFADGWAAVFKVETAIEPWSGALADTGKTLVNNNGVALNQQTANADGSRNGEIFQTSYVGISSKTFGTATIGRQVSINNEIIGAYDPVGGGAYAFAPIEYSGVAGGAGDTQDTRMNQSIKYQIDQIAGSPVHFGMIYQAEGDTGRTGGSEEFNVGATYAGLTVDGVYSHIKDAVSAASLSAAQALAAPGTLKATISDNTAYTLAAKYVYGPATVEGGFEHIYYANPSHPLAAGFVGNGGYDFSVVSNSAYNNNETLSIYWVGGRYKILPKLELAASWYHYSQNDFSGGAKTAGVTCSQSNTAASSCAGNLNAYSMLAEYKFTKRFEMYSGLMYSTVSGGRASGYLNTNTLDPMVGARFKF